MSTGSGPSGGVEEKKALIDSINSSQLEDDVKAKYLARAQGIATDNIVMDGMQLVSKSVADVNALGSEFGQLSADRDALLKQRQAKIAEQLKALTTTPGSKQTSNLSALVPTSGTPSLIV